MKEAQYIKEIENYPHRIDKTFYYDIAHKYGVSHETVRKEYYMLRKQKKVKPLKKISEIRSVII